MEAHQDVLGADVPVDDAGGPIVGVAEPVGVVQSLGHLGGDEERHRDGNALALVLQPGEHGFQIAAAQVLHGQKVVLAHLPEFVHLDDVPVVEWHGDAGLIDEHVDEVPVLDQVGEHPLDHQFLFGALGGAQAGPEDVGHAPRRQQFNEFVPAERCRKIFHSQAPD